MKSFTELVEAARGLDKSYEPNRFGDDEVEEIVKHFKKQGYKYENPGNKTPSLVFRKSGGGENILLTINPNGATFKREVDSKGKRDFWKGVKG